MSSFWHEIRKPIIALAPLADVTDAAFRRVIADYSKPYGPDVFFTEFISADGLYHTREIQNLLDQENPLMRDLMFSEVERPIVAQLFTSKPEMMEYAAALVRELGFDGVDINMGCPDRSVEKQGSGAALIKNPTNAHALIKAAKKGAGGLPISVKTRIGYARNQLSEWLPALLEAAPVAVTIHARTRKELSKVPARWEHIAEAVTIRDHMASDALILGNGDVISVREAREKAAETGADGVMLGRAIFGTPWLFHPNRGDGTPISFGEKMRVLVEHTNLFEELLPHKNFAIMKKHYKAYVSGFEGAKELRNELMACGNAAEVADAIAFYVPDGTAASIQRPAATH